MTNLKFDTIPVTSFRQNCTLLFKEGQQSAALIDPGGEVSRILEAIKARSVRVERIFLTHGHIDHAGGAAELSERLGVEVVGPHRDDAFLLENIAKQGEMYAMPSVRNCTPNRFLKEGDVVEMAGVMFDVLHCPGHTPGHVVFVSRETSFAIVGDVLFQGAVGRTDFPYGSYQALMDSIINKLMSLGDDVLFQCGHGPFSTIGYERLHNPFVHEALSSAGA